MSSDGSHLICKEHSEKTRYCPIEKKWICDICQEEK
jgi:hypothetical protein